MAEERGHFFALDIVLIQLAVQRTMKGFGLTEMPEMADMRS